MGLQTLMSGLVAFFVIGLNNKLRGDLGAFRVELLDRIETKLDGYVSAQNFTTYSEAHAREHFDMHGEITRLRDFRHDINGEIRSLGTKIEDLSIEVKELNHRLEQFNRSHGEEGE